MHDYEHEAHESALRLSSKPTRYSLLSDDDLYLFNKGTHVQIYEKLGAHPVYVGPTMGTYFATWAPDATRVSVIGDFNAWKAEAHPLQPRGSSGIWEGFIPGALPGHRYKYNLLSRYADYAVEKADPYGFAHEPPPRTASIIATLDFAWRDSEWLRKRANWVALQEPLSIYEVHLGSWRRVPEDANRFLTYRELAPLLTDYVLQLGFTHVEFMPVMEHPFYGSWGYQITGYYAPTSRYGSPEDFMYLVDYLHHHGIGVILDWVPSHFATDAHGLAFFDGTHLYEHADPRLGFHPDWKSHIFNYGRNEVRSFLLSNAVFWFDKYHVDGLRVDAVASMLYLDYSRKPGEWVPNRYGGRENLDAIAFLQRLNNTIAARFPGTVTIAEESTAWPNVTRPTAEQGLSFTFKWDMGWMHDTLRYFRRDPIHRRYHQNDLTFRMMYAFSENFVLPLSHDEVVHGKGSLYGRIPGDSWQKMANLRALLGYMFAQPGKKLLFMGGEFGQVREWNHDQSLDWHLLDLAMHAGLQRWTMDLNRLYRSHSALHTYDCHPDGFEWVDLHDAAQSVLIFFRKSPGAHDILVVGHFTPVPRFNYRVGVSTPGTWKELLNSDARCYGGSGHGNQGSVEATPVPWHGRPYSLNLTLPPLGIMFFEAPEKRSG